MSIGLLPREERPEELEELLEEELEPPEEEPIPPSAISLVWYGEGLSADAFDFVLKSSAYCGTKAQDETN
jgi:hypothetical protein